MNKCGLILGSLLIFCVTNCFATDAYSPFNTPACLTSQVKPWNQIPGKETSTAANYAVLITNNCDVSLALVAANSTAGTYNVYPFNIQTVLQSGAFVGALSGSYYIPQNQAVPAGSGLPYFASAFQLYANSKLATGSTTTATGDAFNLYYDASATPTSDGAYPSKTNLYNAPITLAKASWYALALGPQKPDYVKVTLANTTAPQYNLANLTFTQTAEQLGLAAGTNLVVTLDFSNTALPYLGTYQWYPLLHPVLQIPVSVKTPTGRNDILNLNYTVQAAQAPTAPAGFAWQTCTTTSTTGTLSVDSVAGASFPALAKFTCVPGSIAIKHAGIEGMPLKIDDGSVDGLFNDVNNLNAAETGVIVGFANVLNDSDVIELGPNKKTAAQITAWQNNIAAFQNSGHVVLISFGGTQTANTQSIVQWAFSKLNPSTVDKSCDSAAACAGVLNRLDTGKKYFNEAVAAYETVIKNYKPNGIDVAVSSTDLNPLANEFTAEVLKIVMTNVLAENPNFVLSLSLTPTTQATFGDANKAFMASLANQSVTPTYINAVYRQFTTAGTKPAGCTSKTVTGTCIVNSLTAYIAEYNDIWRTPAHAIYPGIMPMALQDYSDTIEIWPANLVMSDHRPQLDGIFSNILSAQPTANQNIAFPASVLFSYWNTAYDFAGGYISKSYPSNQYQLELASYANTPYQIPSAIKWNPSQLTVSKIGPTYGTINWQPATDTISGAHLTYIATLYLNGQVSAQQEVEDCSGDTCSFIFDQGLVTGTAYRVILQVEDDKGSPPVWRTTWLKTTGNPNITWLPNLIAQGNADGVTGFAKWNCAVDSDNTATLAYSVTIDGGGIVGSVDNANCQVNFTGLKVGTTYNVTVAVSDNRSGAIPTSSPAKVSFATTSTAPAALKEPTQYTWDPKPDHTGILTFNAATGGLPPYSYQIIISPSGAGTSLPFTALTACPYADCSLVNTDNMYRVSGMTFGVTYQVSIVAMDAAGVQAGMQMFKIMDSN